MQEPAIQVVATAEAEAATAQESATTREPAWHALAAEDVLQRLDSAAGGLTSADAAARLASHGPNVLPRASGDGPLTLLLRQVDSPLIWVLLASAITAILLGKVLDGLVVLAVVVVNTIIGFIQEYRAGQAIGALLQMVPETATVLRDGRRTSLPAADVVPGDIVALASGDRVPADLRILESRSLRAEEAALTGESVPAEKQAGAVPEDAGLGDRASMLYGGTHITYGTAEAVVVATGQATQLGRISDLLKSTVDLDTPLTGALRTIGGLITVAILVMAVVMLAIGVVRMTAQGLSLSDAFSDSLLFAIALAVGAIPEGLPAIVTIALAIGVQRMAHRRAIVRKLPAVETLGSTTTICSDKTGTLTRNEMTVKAIWTPAVALEVSGVGYAPIGTFRLDGEEVERPPEDVRALLLDAALCSDATLERTAEDGWRIAGDPTEGALVVVAEKAGLDVHQALSAWPRLDAIPFESERQYMATLHDGRDGSRRAILKGAPEVLLARSDHDPEGRPLSPDIVHAAVERLAAAGMRVLAIAERELGPEDMLSEEVLASGCRFLGLVGMIDPPRPEAIAAVETSQRAGIAVKMITGDHRLTAEAIGGQLGLRVGDGAVTGARIERMDDAELRETVGRTDVFARVAPEHKLRLVQALQAERHVVAMTGDGVNDAPALKQANIGVAMGITGSAVSKESADIVLTDDNFASIAAAVEEGRRVYDNLVKALAFVLPTNLGLALILIFAVLFFPFDVITSELLLPMAPTQLLWINLVATVTLALPLALEAPEPDLMQRGPRDPDAPILSRFVLWRTALVGLLMAAGAIGLFLFEYDGALGRGVDEIAALAEAQTMAVTTVVMFQAFYLLNCRSLRDSIFTIGVFSNPSVLVGIAVLMLLQAAFVYLPILNDIFGTRPLDPQQVALAALVGAIVLPVISFEKWLERRRQRSA
jgi:magnesium-transporting ATPase (P-type)